MLGGPYGPARRFVGEVWLDPIALPHEPGQTMVVATVRFAPGARTAWHWPHPLGTLPTRGDKPPIAAGWTRAAPAGQYREACPI